MDSLDLLTQTAYPAANHLQYQYQDQQMGITDFRDGSNQQFDLPQASTNGQTIVEVSGQGESAPENCIESLPEEELTNSTATNSFAHSQHTSNQHHHQIGHHQQQTNAAGQSNNRPIIDGIAERIADSEPDDQLETDEHQEINNEEQEEANDEDSFVAFCTDASSVLNNDPTRRYFINKLYQPMNGQQEDSSSALVEQDDDYLLYQELQGLFETDPQNERQRVQLTKILEDDDGEDDQLLVDSVVGQREDSLHLTTIINAFDSFPASPLDNGRDPLISEASEHQQQDKPDSTRHGGEISPSSNSSSSGHGNSITSSYISSVTNLHDHHHHNQLHHQQPSFDCDPNDSLQQFGMSHHKDDEENPHFLSMNPEISHESHQQHHHHHHLNNHNGQQQQYNISEQRQMNKEDPSEISCFQSISSNFMSSTDSTLITQQKQQPESQGHMDTTANNNNELHQKTSSSQAQAGRQSRKRCLQHIDDGNDEASSGETKQQQQNSRTAIKSKTKKKRSSPPDDSSSRNNVNKNNSSTAQSATPIIMSNDYEQSTSRGSNNNNNITTSSNIYKTTGEYQQEHITQVKDDHHSEDNDHDVSNLSLDDEATSSAAGGRRHSSMSKYRRRTANARERIRMREINQAFEKLKKVVPIELIQQSMSGDESDQTSASSRRGASNKSGNGRHQQASDSQSVKLTKITTLRLAVSYIAKLSEVLNNHTECSSTGSNGNNIDRSSFNNSSNVTSNVLQVGDSINKVKITTDESKGTLARKRRARRPSTAKKQQADNESVVTMKERWSSLGTVVSKAGEVLKIKQQPSTVDNQNSPMKQGISESTQGTVVLNQTTHSGQARHQPILIANNICGQIRQHQTAFLPIQQQHPSPPQQQQQFAYATCNQQPLAISQTSNINGQDRTFVTPLAVAILGIQTGNNQNLNEPQTVQLLGIQGAQQHHLQQRQQQQQQHLQQQHHQIQSTNGHYNLIATQQPQQVTLTLDDINGLSVLRLTNPHTPMRQHQQTIQLQQGRPIVHQPAQILATQSNGGGQSGHQQYNYTTYQPLQISQVQSAAAGTNLVSANRPISQQGATIQLQNHTGHAQCRMLQSNTNGPSLNEHAFGTDNNQSSSSISSQTTQSATSNASAATTMAANTTTPPTTTNTGINSDCRTFGISPTMIAQHLNNDNVVQTTQFKIQQSNRSGQQILQNSQLVTVPAGTQLFQAPHNCQSGSASTTPAQTNLIYINPPISLQSNTNGHQNHQNSSQTILQQQHCNNHQIAQKQQKVAEYGTTNGGASSFEQMKFVTQFSSQTNPRSQDSKSNLHNSEASIRQLVATLATSIHPKGSNKQGKTNSGDQNSNQQSQQPKRTYRFHNYDGNMITNHSYSNNNTTNNNDSNSNNADRQQQVNKKCHQQQQQHSDQTSNSQRSRQNSLSSTCSTTSYSSLSLASLSSASPSIMIKSPILESSSSSSSSSSSASSTSGVLSAHSSADETTEMVVVVGSN